MVEETVAGEAVESELVAEEAVDENPVAEEATSPEVVEEAKVEEVVADPLASRERQNVVDAEEDEAPMTPSELFELLQDDELEEMAVVPTAVEEEEAVEAEMQDEEETLAEEDIGTESVVPTDLDTLPAADDPTDSATIDAAAPVESEVTASEVAASEVAASDQVADSPTTLDTRAAASPDTSVHATSAARLSPWRNELSNTNAVQVQDGNGDWNSHVVLKRSTRRKQADSVLVKCPRTGKVEWIQVSSSRLSQHETRVDRHYMICAVCQLTAEEEIVRCASPECAVVAHLECALPRLRQVPKLWHCPAHGRRGKQRSST